MIFIKLILSAVLLFAPAFIIKAEEVYKEPVFFIAGLCEISYYGGENPSMGDGLSIASDGRFAVGLGGMYFHEVRRTDDGIRILALEFTAFLRYYFHLSCLGPFLQFNGGYILAFREDDVKLPAVSGSFSAGLTFGWRFPLGNTFYVEPYVRGGHPFIIGGGAAAGFRL